jgi:predicted  nucleic acid-binding Zn-ribbon protein
MEPRDQKTEPTLHDVMGILHTMSEQITGVEQDVRKIKVDMADMKETVEAIERAVDKDAETLVEHDIRITKLEEARA